MQASAGGADARREQILDRRLAILLLERDAPRSARMFFADGRQGISNQSQALPRQQTLDPQACRVGDGGLNVVADQAVVQNIVVPGGEAEHSCVERSSLVPESCHCSGRGLSEVAMDLKRPPRSVVPPGSRP